MNQINEDSETHKNQNKQGINQTMKNFNEKAYLTSVVFVKPWLTEQGDIRASHQDKLSQGRLPELARCIGQSAQTEKFL